MERSESAAFRFADEIDQTIQLIVDSPERWPRREYSTRSFVLRRFPFAIVYRSKDDQIQVLAVAHGHKRPTYWNDRL